MVRDGERLKNNTGFEHQFIGGKVYFSETPADQCEKLGGVKLLNTSIEQIRRDYEQQLARQKKAKECAGGGLTPIFGCKAAQAWKRFEEPIIKVADVVAISTTGYPLASLAKAGVDAVEGISSNDPDKFRDGFTRAVGTAASSPALRSSIGSVFEGTEVGQFFAENPDVFGRVHDASKYLDRLIEDPESMRETLRDGFRDLALDQIGMGEGEFESMIDDVLCVSISEPLREIGVSFATDVRELERFVSEELNLDELSPEIRREIDSIAIEIRDSVSDRLESEFDGTLPSGVRDVIFREAPLDDLVKRNLRDGLKTGQIFVEDAVIDAVVRGAKDPDLNRALRAIKGAADVIAESGDLFSGLRNHGVSPSQVAQFSERFRAYVHKRGGALNNQLSQGRFQADMDAVQALDPTLFQSVVETLERTRGPINYIKNSHLHEQVLQQIVKLPNSEDYEKRRDEHVAEISKRIVELQGVLEDAEFELKKVRQAIAEKRLALEQKQGEKEIEQALLQVREHYLAAKGKEVESAMTGIVISQLERVGAERRLEVLRLSEQEHEKRLRALEKELESARMLEEAAKIDVAIAELEKQRHEAVLSVSGKIPPFWQVRNKERAVKLAQKALLDMARTLDFISINQGGDHLSIVKGVGHSVKELNTRYDALRVFLFERKLNAEWRTTDPTINVTVSVSESDVNKALVIPEFQSTPDGDVEIGKFLVWQLDIFKGTVAAPRRHPGKGPSPHGDQDGRNHMLIPEGLFPDSKVIEVGLDSALKKPLFERLRVSTSVNASESNREGFPVNSQFWLVHLGDMWFEEEAVQSFGVAPVVSFSEHGEWGIPGIGRLTELLNNNQYWIERSLPRSHGLSDEVSHLDLPGNFGANQPLLGTWWLMLRETSIKDSDRWNLTLGMEGSGLVTNGVNLN